MRNTLAYYHKVSFVALVLDGCNLSYFSSLELLIQLAKNPTEMCYLVSNYNGINVKFNPHIFNLIFETSELPHPLPLDPL